ncbi:MAG: 2-dehydropantoate 2-reductase [Candidatus Acidiferrales bacterium]
MNAKPRVAVMGAGAVGSYFGGMLARAGVPVVLIGRPAHVEAIRRDKLFMDTVTFQERVPVEASSDPADVAGADVVLFCVKGQDNEASSRAVSPYLAPGAIVVSLQNGVDNVAAIRAASGIDSLPAVVYIAAVLPEPGHVKHLGRGELAVGELTSGAASPGSSSSAHSSRPEKIAALFASAGVSCRISEYIEADIWAKFIMNCAGNAVAAIAQCSYAEAVRNPASRELMQRLMEETVTVGRAAGMRLPDVKYFMEEGIKSLGSFGNATSSTAHDLARGKSTEIESLNGYVVRRGAELGVTTPCSFSVYAMVKLLEETEARRQQHAKPASSSQ